MRIGIDCRLWDETGVGRYTRNLIRNLERIDQDNSYYLFVKSDKEKEISSDLPANFKVVSTNIHWHTIREQVFFAGVIEKYSLDLMHFPYFSLPINYKKTFVLTIHDLIIHHFSTGKASTLPAPIYYLKRLAYLYLMQKAANRSSKIIAVSESTKKEIIDHLMVEASKIKVIYEGVDESISPKRKQIFNFPYILYVGNAYPHKNLELMIEAFKKAKKGKEKLVLVGRTNFFYKRLEREFKDESIIFFGEATDEDLGSLYANAKAFVMPSFMEGFGLPPLEAMKNSCFVIASDIPSIREVCADAALYFNPYDISDISDKIKFAFSDSDKRDFIKRGLERVKKFSWIEMAKKTLKVYESSQTPSSG